MLNLQFILLCLRYMWGVGLKTSYEGRGLAGTFPNSPFTIHLYSTCWKPERWGSSHSDQLGPFHAVFPNPHSLTLPQTISVSGINFHKRSPSSISTLIRSTQLDTRRRTFFPELLPNSPDTYEILTITPPGTLTSLQIVPAIILFLNWISSSQIDTLNDPDMHSCTPNSTTTLAPVPLQISRWLLLIHL